MRGNLKRAEGRGTRADRPARSVRVARWLAIPVGMVASSLLVWQASNAAFSDTTENPGNSWASGTVELSDDDNNTAMFNVDGLEPGKTGTNCIQVTYTGSLESDVKLYVSPPTGTLAPYLNLTVEQGSGGTFADCTGFVADATNGTVYNGTLDGLATTASDFATGLGVWTPTGTGQAKTYKLTYTLQNNNDAQGKSAGATFTWEAQNTTP